MIEWVKLRMNMWMNEWKNKYMNMWKKRCICKSKDEKNNEWVKWWMTNRMNRWIGEWLGERMNKWMDGWTSVRLEKYYSWGSNETIIFLRILINNNDWAKSQVPRVNLDPTSILIYLMRSSQCFKIEMRCN